MKEQITKLQGKVDRLDRWWRDCVHRREPYQVFVKDELDKAKAELAQLKSEWANLQRCFPESAELNKHLWI